MGEASRPGPRQGICILSLNVSSLSRHRQAVLDLAEDHHSQVIFLQETGVTQAQTPTLSNYYHRKGWQYLGLPAATLEGGGRGGIGILVQYPLGLSLLASHTQARGQVMLASFLGTTRPLHLMCAYRRPGPGNDILPEVTQLLQAHPDRPWMIAADFNLNPLQGVLPDTLRYLGASLGNVGYHNSSREPTDSVWVSPALRVIEAAELPPVSDHTVMMATLQGQCPEAPAPAWELRKAAPLASQEETSEPAVMASVAAAWDQVAMPQAAWHNEVQNGDPLSLWDQWSKDAEGALKRAGVVAATPAARPRGTLPALQSAASPAGSGQDSKERELRRFLRRLHEAKTCCDLGKHPDAGLLRNLRQGATRWHVRQQVRANQWQPAITECHRQLQHMLKQQQDRRMTEWRLRMTDYAHAAKWVKASARPPWLLKQADGNVSVGTSKGVQALREAWAPLFTGGPNYVPDVASYMRAYGHHHPQRQVASDTPLEARQLQKAAGAMKHKAHGMDNWEARALLQLPTAAWQRLAQVLMAVEQVGTWPPALLQWRVCFIPKDNRDRVTVGSIVYRCWSKARFQEIAHALHPDILAQYQYGGLQGHDAETLVLCLEQESTCQTHKNGASLDFFKAFDCTDWQTAHALLCRAGVAQGVLRALEGMWKHHQRWVTFGHAVNPRPIGHVQSLLQGDVWAPLAMSLVLAGPLKSSQAARPQSMRQPTSMTEPPCTEAWRTCSSG